MTSPADTRRRFVDWFWSTPWLLLSLAPLFWAGNFVIGRAILATQPAIALSFWRWTLALIPVLVLAHGRVDWRREFKVLRGDPGIVVLLGILSFAVFNTFVYIGLQSTTSLNALLMQSAMPLMILLACYLLFAEPPSRVQLLGVVLSLAGVLFIATRGHPASLASLSVNAGDIWVLVAVAAYATYSALLRKRPALHPLAFLAAVFAVGAITLLPFYIAEHLSGRVLHPTPQLGAAMVYLVIFPSFLSALFFNRGVELAGAARAGVFIHLIPVFGSVLAVVFLGERFEGFHLIGTGLIAAGLLIASRRRRG